ncbi:hypothetical protein ACIQPR_48410 [Streptomyces sp. NPDC091280]|uniref:hypothetical protein n=1 Tax=Streptomyces sp. NPDC091280 TaxID=3365984 RepID=UPI003827E4E3
MRRPRLALLDLSDRPAPEPAALTDAPSGRVMRQVIALLLLACGSSLIGEALTCGSLYGLPWTWSVQAGYRLFWVRFGVAAVVFFWLAGLVIARTPLSRVTPRQRLLQRGAAVLSASVAMFGTAPFVSALAQLVGQSVGACVLAWLALEVCRAHRVPVRIAFPRTAPERLRDWDIAFLVLIACVAGGATSFLLAQLIRYSGLDVPLMKGGQMSTLGIGNLGTFSIGVVATVAVEDVVLVAVTTALLTATRRPAWQIYTLICVPEVLLHAYLGLPAIGMLLFAAGRVWLYRQYGRPLPFMAAHFVYDLVTGGLMLAQGLSFLYRPVVGLLFATAVFWIDHRLTEAAHRAGPEPQSQPAALGSDPPQPADRPERVSTR